MTNEQALAFANQWAAAWNELAVERVLEHFSDDVMFTSPTAAAFVGTPTVHGKQALRDYWTTALARVGTVRFAVDRVVWDASSRELAIIYVADVGGRKRRASENLTFGPDGLVASAEVFHGVDA